MRRLGLRKTERFCLVETLAALPLHAITENGPGRPGKADQRDLSFQFLIGLADSFQHIPQAYGNVWHQNPVYVGGRPDRLGEPGAYPGLHLHFYIHGLGHHQNVAEEYGGIHPVPPDGLYRNFRGEFRGLAAREKIIFIAQGHEFGQVTARLPHHPNGGAGHIFSPKGLQE